MRKRLALLATLTMGGVALFAALALAAPAQAWPASTSYYVDPAGNNGHTCLAPGATTACLTIGGALGKASAGDKIFVAAGTYHEHLTLSKNITLIGAGASSTTIDGSAADRVIMITSGVSVVLADLTIKNGKTAGNGGGIYNDGALALDNSLVNTNTANLGGGIYSTHYLTLTHTSVLTNAAILGGGIYNFGPPFATPADVTLDNSQVRGNRVISDGAGLYNTGALLGSAHLVVQNNSLVSLNTAVGGSGAGIYNTAWLTLTNSTVSFNASRGTSPQDGGGGLFNAATGHLALTGASLLNNNAAAQGGGLANLGTTSAAGLLVQGNVVSGAFGSGAGIYSFGSLSLIGGTITGNTFGPAGGDGAGLQSAGWVTITHSLISHNASNLGFGGGVLNFANGSLSIDTTTLSDNSSLSGGAIYNQQAKIRMTASTLSGNQAAGDGGALLTYGTGSSVVMTNTTVSGNQAGSSGGGIWASQIVSLNNVTVAFNVAGGPSGGGVQVPLTSTPVLTSVNTLIADNLSTGALDCHGSITSLGYNLIGNNQGCDFHANGGTDLVGTPNHRIDPMLSGLALNGNLNGPFTDALFAGSPALGAGSPLASPNATACASADERGVARPAPGCDIGAFQGFVALHRQFLPLIGR